VCESERERDKETERGGWEEKEGEGGVAGGVLVVLGTPSFLLNETETKRCGCGRGAPFLPS